MGSEMCIRDRYGGDGDDFLFGDSTVFVMMPGDDLLCGGEGTDTINGGGGADIIDEDPCPVI